jgi:hypothetical protein
MRSDIDTTLMHNDNGSPSKLSKRRRTHGTQLINDMSTIHLSKAKTKIGLCLFALSIYIGIHLEQDPSIVDISSDVTFQGNNQDHRSIPTKAISDDATSLALLFPPGLLGGYRNQVLRFIAFVVYAKQNNISQLLLPSLLWSTKIHIPVINGTRFINNVQISVGEFPIPFEWIYDVDHWNSYYEYLPTLVQSNQMSTSRNVDCWVQPSEMHDIAQLQNAARYHVSNNQNNSHVFYYEYFPPTRSYPDIDNHPILINHLQRAVLLQGLIQPIAVNVTIPILTGRKSINPRKQNFATETEHCTNPRVYGGGKMSGVLWNAYISYQKTYLRSIPSQIDTSNPTSNIINKSFVPFDTDVWIYRALRPAEKWRNVAMQCIKMYAPTGNFIALHARVELEMMSHTCGKNMERNLTKIVQYVYQLYNDQPQTIKSSLSGLFIAVSRAGMEITYNYRNSPFRAYAEENLHTLNRLTGTRKSPNSFDEVIPAFECGETMLKQYYESNPNIPDHGTLLQSVINFYIAVSSDIFIGVAQSSYSTDILTTRYWLGKGLTNYRYTKDGIEAVENDGLPVPHGNCQRSS